MRRRALPVPDRVAATVLVAVRLLRKSSRPPTYATDGASGLDLVADLASPLVLAPLERALVQTGIELEIPLGYEGQIRARSGRALREGLALVNAPGTVDSDYRGEIHVLLINLGQAPISIRPGDRIAQLVLAPVVRAELVKKDVLRTSVRGAGGFGHTGL